MLQKFKVKIFGQHGILCERWSDGWWRTWYEFTKNHKCVSNSFKLLHAMIIILHAIIIILNFLKSRITNIIRSNSHSRAGLASQSRRRVETSIRYKTSTIIIYKNNIYISKYLYILRRTTLKQKVLTHNEVHTKNISMIIVTNTKK